MPPPPLDEQEPVTLIVDVAVLAEPSEPVPAAVMVCVPLSTHGSVTCVEKVPSLCTVALPKDCGVDAIVSATVEPACQPEPETVVDAPFCTDDAGVPTDGASGGYVAHAGPAMTSAAASAHAATIRVFRNMGLRASSER
jgi:hypothetical protein